MIFANPNFMIFVSAPYSHPIANVIELRVRAVSIYSAKLLQSGCSVLTPLTAGTCILKYTTLPNDFEFWKKMSLDMLRVCDEVHVLKLDGWDTSTGVAAEIEFAQKNNIHIKYIDKENILHHL